MKPHLHHILKGGFFLLFLVILYRIIDVDLLLEAMTQVRFDIVGVATLAYFVNIGIRAYRLQMILNQHRKLLSFKDAYHMTLIGIALNIVIPATMGDIAKSYYGYKRYGLKEEMLSTTVVDKICALCSLFLLGTASAFFLGYTFLAVVSLGCTLLTLLPVLYPSRIPWRYVNLLLRYINKRLEPEKLLTTFQLSYQLKFFVMGISLLGWLATCVFFYMLCLAFPVTVRLGYIIAIMPVITIVRLFPFTINALGPTEMAVAYFFNRIGITSTLAVLISVTSNLIASILPGMIGFAWLLIRKTRKNGETCSGQENDAS